MKIPSGTGGVLESWFLVLFFFFTNSLNVIIIPKHLKIQWLKNFSEKQKVVAILKFGIECLEKLLISSFGNIVRNLGLQKS